MDSTQLHVAIVSSPGMGHLIPVLVLLGNRLATHHNIKITILTITTNSSSREIEFLKKFNEKKTIEIIHVPSVDISHLTNTWEELEGETIKEIGPLRRTIDITEHDQVIQWLDKQNQKSNN